MHDIYSHLHSHAGIAFLKCNTGPAKCRTGVAVNRGILQEWTNTSFHLYDLRNTNSRYLSAQYTLGK